MCPSLRSSQSLSPEVLGRLQMLPYLAIEQVAKHPDSLIVFPFRRNLVIERQPRR